MDEHQIWGYLYRELAKLNAMLLSYEKLFNMIEVKNNRYNPIFQLFLDSFTSYVFITLPKFFDKGKGTWSLYRFKLLDQADIDKVKSLSEKFIKDRHTKYAHLSKSISHIANFTFLSQNGVKEVREIIEKINTLMVEIDAKYNYKEAYHLDWIGVSSSLQCMTEDLKNYDHMKE